MRLNEYQELSKRTFPANKGQSISVKEKNLANYGMGISGEAGEVTDLLKKCLFHGHKLEREEVIKELGDVMHYVAGIAYMFDTSLEEVATANIEKLRKRYPDGFSMEASVNRED